MTLWDFCYPQTICYIMCCRLMWRKLFSWLMAMKDWAPIHLNLALTQFLHHLNLTFKDSISKHWCLKLNHTAITMDIPRKSGGTKIAQWLLLKSINNRTVDTWDHLRFCNSQTICYKMLLTNVKKVVLRLEDQSLF